MSSGIHGGESTLYIFSQCLQVPGVHQMVQDLAANNSRRCLYGWAAGPTLRAGARVAPKRMPGKACIHCTAVCGVVPPLVLASL